MYDLRLDLEFEEQNPKTANMKDEVLGKDDWLFYCTYFQRVLYLLKRVSFKTLPKGPANGRGWNKKGFIFCCFSLHSPAGPNCLLDDGSKLPAGKTSILREENGNCHQVCRCPLGSNYNENGPTFADCYQQCGLPNDLTDFEEGIGNSNIWQPWLRRWAYIKTSVRDSSR